MVTNDDIAREALVHMDRMFSQMNKTLDILQRAGPDFREDVELLQDVRSLLGNRRVRIYNRAATITAELDDARARADRTLERLPIISDPAIHEALADLE